jgi:inorganic pyrophosphatase
MDNDFWEYLEKLIERSSLVIDRPRGSVHPRYPDLVYPLDYGYLEDTVTSDGGGKDFWIGEGDDRELRAIVCTIDLVKKDVEIKVLIGCSETDI